MVEAGGTPKVKPSDQHPWWAVIGAEGVADRTSGHTSLTAGSHLEAPAQGRGQHQSVQQTVWQAQGHSQPQAGHW